MVHQGKTAGRSRAVMRLSARLIIFWLYFAAVIAACAAEEDKETADALRRASDVVLKARKASDLDGSLIELHRLAAAPARFRSGNPERESASRLYELHVFCGNGRIISGPLKAKNLITGSES